MRRTARIAIPGVARSGFTNRLVLCLALGLATGIFTRCGPGADASQAVPSSPAESRCSISPQENVILENAAQRAVFSKEPAGYGSAAFFVRDGRHWRQVAVSNPLGHFAWRSTQGQDFEADILPQKANILARGGREAAVRLTGEHVDAGGCRWTFSFTYSLAADKGVLTAHYTAQADQDRQLLFFQGPELRAGQGSFGGKKDFAVFSGLEYLEGEERSSSTRDMVAGLANRYAPHPYKVTMPFMAVENQGCLVGLMWDPLQKWDGRHITPSARFASPNWKDTQENHLMGLFLPSIPTFVPENKDRAAKPYPLAAGTTLELKAHIVTQLKAGVLDMPAHYFAVFGLPGKFPLAEDYDRIMERCRVGYMKTFWDPKAVGVKHWSAGPPRPYSNACSILWNDAAWSSDPEAKKAQKERVELMVAKVLSDQGVAGLIDPVDTRAFGTLPCHIRGYLLPFYVGWLEGGLKNWKERIYQECLGKQKEDGSWEVVGNPGCQQGPEPVSGTIAELAGATLMHARVTGDRRSLEAGLRALRRLDQFAVPRGAQTWEVPKNTPDILASGHALWAYLEAYQITGDRQYLDKAVYWARTGLHFVYVWQAPGVPLMTYCTTCVYGTSNFSKCWIGRPVQWCGLVYAYWLLRLAEFDQGGPWRIIGQGIVDNGIQQMLNMWDQGAGIYPDSIGLIDGVVDTRYCFEPENLMKPILLARRQTVEVSTRVLAAGSGRIHVSTAARLVAAAYDAPTKTVSCQIEYPKGEVSYLVIAGAVPAEIRKDSAVLGRVGDLDAAEEGWKISEDGLVLAKVRHPQLAVRLELTTR